MAFDWNELSWPKRIAIAVPIFGAGVGWQYYTKGQEAVEMKAQMVAMCEGEAPCVAAVEQHAETCFNDNYRMGRRSQGVKMDEFVACVNDHSGTQFFISEPSD
jgi:hypothetical protein